MTTLWRNRIPSTSSARPRPRRDKRRLSAAAVLGCVVASAVAGAAPAHADELRDREWPLAFLHAAQSNRISTGSGVTVALLDSGVVNRRADLTGQVTTGPDYAGGVERPGQTGWGEHGTCMASIIAGHGRGGGDGMLGIAPGAHVLSVRVIRDDDAPDIDRPTTSNTPISDGIRYAVDHGAQVISMSLGGSDAGADTDSTPEADAIRYALDHNVVVVAAAGNSADKGDAIQFPGAERGVISVAAVDSAGRHAAFSTTSWDVAVAAPGVNLPCDAAVSDDEFLLGDGTSQATAYVAGIAALLKSENRALSPAQVRDILEQTARDKPAGGRDDRLGFGIVDPVAALKAAVAVKGKAEAPAAARSQPAGGHFGYGPAAVVSEAAPAFGALPRAIAGGLVLLLGAAAVGYRLLRRARRDALAALPPYPVYPVAYPPPAGGWPPPPQQQPDPTQPQSGIPFHPGAQPPSASARPPFAQPPLAQPPGDSRMFPPD
ncbi:S8 family serine peptidase [Actinocrinis puniceicyclus]|uniref:S8 family serine peptidase n=1 Tax=Actinocrinis puniceicyclus TaxID=977794 RepID=A0A8J7WGG1_9ACTN|nr:S8 family serine peptidase [Actinocrinis puniceicyclus]MBS2961676.1 S8 family serine peptidase [Actinocrinis puniceicyclus]